MEDGGYREPGPAPRTFESIGGTDSLRHDGDRLVVFSPEPMAEWTVGRNRRTAVHFRGERYAVAQVRPVVGGHEFVLVPWPPRANELPSQEIIYDDAYVRSRQEDARLFRERRREAWLIAPVWPFLGFLPQGLKTKLQLRFGFEPVSGTRLSVILELVALVLLLIFTWFRVMNGVDWLTMRLFGGGEIRDTLLVIAILTDLAFRGSILFDDEHPPYGFWGWIAHPDLVEHLRGRYEAFREWRDQRR